MSLISRTIGFSAARLVPPGNWAHTLRSVLLSALPAPATETHPREHARFVTGGATGGDSLIGRWLALHYPWDAHLVIVPANRAQISAWWRLPEFSHVSTEEMPPGTSYKDRNSCIVELSDEMFCFPANKEDDPRSRRSGTWQTIRLAREAGVPVSWFAVDSSACGIATLHARGLDGIIRAQGR